MECYNHKEKQGVGLCKSCFKAICRECAIEIPNGLACSDSCAKEISECNEINERGKKIYGIGSYKSRMPSTGLIVWALFAFVAWFTFLVRYLINDKFDSGTLVIALIFTIVAGLAWYSSKRTGIQC